jgi:hypothetical protein
MQSGRHIVEWHGEPFNAKLLKSSSRVQALSPVWAVHRRGEFIGTLPYRLDEPPEEFEVRCLNWLGELLESTPLKRPPHERYHAAPS